MGRDRDPDRPVNPGEGPGRVGDMGGEGYEASSGTGVVTEHPSGGEIATMVPSGVLPPVEYRDLPEPLPFRRIVGASVIILATALGSGELILWPYITTQVGIGVLWLAVVGFTMQYFLNMEIERYTLATGETAVTGFTRFWKPWGIIFCLGAILPNLSPGIAASGATLFTYLFGIPEGAAPYICVGFLVTIGLFLTLSPVIYQFVEKTEMVLVSVILIFLVVALFIATDASSWVGVVAEAPRGVANFGGYLGELGVAALLGAIAFAGAGGANNLVQSNYIRDKGLGMGAYIPRIVSPITGEEEARPSIGYMTKTDDENMRRWRGWWKVANQEQLFLFYGVGLLSLIALSVLANSTLGTRENVGEDLAFVQEEAGVLRNVVAPWFATFFLVAATIKLFATSLGILDYVSRLTADSLKVSFLKDSSFWSESKVYVTVAWFMIVVGSFFVLSGVEPIVLLIITSAGGGVVMAFYSAMLLVLNRRALPEQIRLRGYRLAVIAFAAVFFGLFAVALLADVILSNAFGSSLTDVLGL